MIAKIVILLAFVASIAFANEAAPSLTFSSQTSGKIDESIQQAQQTIGDAANQVGQAGTSLNQQEKLMSSNAIKPKPVLAKPDWKPV